ncbi:uncharacterized protein LOC111373492 [Olea europaea var. sylvestris]|uniref:uncharacterized protein LOC111373492 n=1 Tax=Olea europaea var. sylvestris TaxID=158386 RepID=UPI000C1D2DEE|nr:uncharacterized protein LOC111373492 [Olea europaea var. sylvestris]
MGLLQYEATKWAQGHVTSILYENSSPEEDVDIMEATEEGHPLDELDPQIIESESNATPMEELETFPINLEDPIQILRVGKALPPRMKEEMMNFLKKTWMSSPGSTKIWESIYPKWISNPVLVKKPIEKWKVCVDFTNLNKACPKDSFPLPSIDQLMDSTAGHELLSFMEVYLRYNQIPMFRPDEESISFITDRGLYYYKCTFGVASDQFLGYIVNQRGIKANLKKIRALLEMRATDKSLPFFKVLKQGKKFQWISKCEEAFQGLKKHLGEVPLLSKPQLREPLLLYLVVSNEAISAVIVKEENMHQLSVYYISKTLLPTEASNPDMEKLSAIRGQTLADFVAEFAKAPEMEATIEPVEPPPWSLFVDRSSGETGSRAGVILESPEGHKLNCTVRFGFKASNNAVEYEALLAGLRLAKEMQVTRLLASSDSQLVGSQVNEKFTVKDSGMTAYLNFVMNLVPHFERFELVQVPCLKNTYTDALSKLASSRDSELLKIIPIERLPKPSISGGEDVLWIEDTQLWMQPIEAYLKVQSLPTSKSEAKKLRMRAAHFVL